MGRYRRYKRRTSLKEYVLSLYIFIAIVFSLKMWADSGGNFIYLIASLAFFTLVYLAVPYILKRIFFGIVKLFSFVFEKLREMIGSNAYTSITINIPNTNSTKLDSEKKEFDMRAIDRMSGEDFEKYLLEIFEFNGYKGHLTPKTADYGADLVLEKDKRKIVVQAKRWSRIVRIDAIQQVIGAIKHYGADKGIVIATSDFTENAYELATSNGIELWDRRKLINYINEHSLISDIEISHTNTEGFSTIDDDDEICPWCGRHLTVRHGSKGEFLGCLGFPKCRYTRQIP